MNNVKRIIFGIISCFNEMIVAERVRNGKKYYEKRKQRNPYFLSYHHLSRTNKNKICMKAE
jgi:hypothetical protein